MKQREYPLSIKLFRISLDGLLRVKALSRAPRNTGTRGLYWLLQTAHAALWLGVLDRDRLLVAEQILCDTSSQYVDDSYNRQGFWGWELAAINTYFRESRRFLVGAAGGGREVHALCKLGYEVDGFECNPDLVEYANDQIRREGYTAHIQLAPPDECPVSDRTYDGLIVGWAAYPLIQGRKRRIAFLKGFRAQARDHAPILLSCPYRTDSNVRFQLTAAVANAIRRVSGREPVELGDHVGAYYVHHFTREQLASELQEAGFDLQCYVTEGYGYGVGIAARSGTPLALAG